VDLCSTYVQLKKAVKVGWDLTGHFWHGRAVSFLKNVVVVNRSYTLVYFEHYLSYICQTEQLTVLDAALWGYAIIVKAESYGAVWLPEENKWAFLHSWCKINR